MTGRRRYSEKGKSNEMYLEEFEVGQKFPLEEVLITREQAISFSQQYDPLPVHQDEEYAKTTRFGALIAPGVMCFMLVWKRFLEQNALGDEVIAGKSTCMEWFAPVYVGDRLRCTAVISALTPRNPYNGVVEVTVDVYNQHGDYVLHDITEMVVQRRPV